MSILLQAEHDKHKNYHKRIVKQLYFAPALSCADLSVRIDRSLPVTTKMISSLIDKGYILEKGLAQSTGGRRAATYALRPDMLYTVSVAMDQFVTRLALMDLHNHYVTPVERVDLPLAQNPEGLQQLVQRIEALISTSGIAKEKIAGIGLGMPGFIDVKKGINYSFWEHEGSITKKIGEKTGLPVFLDNDSSLIALAELRFGLVHQRHNALVVNIGWGIGLGMVLNNELFRGHNGFAGEFSHISIFQNSRLCGCGKTGCLETEASMMVVVEKAKEAIVSGRVSQLHLSDLVQMEGASETIIQAARKGDRFAVELLSETAYKIGRGVAILIHIINPEVIILSGRGSGAGKLWQAPIQQAINEHCIPRLAANTTIEVSQLGHQAELIGAAALVMEHYVKEESTTGRVPQDAIPAFIEANLSKL